MYKFIDLCVELRVGSMAKEGLLQYRQITMNNIQILFEPVVKYFLSKANEAARYAFFLFEFCFYVTLFLEMHNKKLMNSSLTWEILIKKTILNR